ncbi:response regulator transcription factor [Croceicoccus bisphenolivorans]|uniref:response regulator transcription factor n=1 Tax=Croceicoccus bisphenolivorans TaxID=1783232 RepID=UPI0008298A7E|nr:response regulator [Croceicoccus bisphenolivorans]
MAYILVADDDEILAEMVRHRLSAVGHEVATVEDGQQLLDQIDHRLPDAILLDAMMPILSGMDTLEQLKENPLHRDIPVVMMTARRSQQDVLAALKAGAADYVTKPFSPEDLALRIEGLLARRRSVSADGGFRHSLH